MSIDPYPRCMAQHHATGVGLRIAIGDRLALVDRGESVHRVLDIEGECCLRTASPVTGRLSSRRLTGIPRYRDRSERPIGDRDAVAGRVIGPSAITGHRPDSRHGPTAASRSKRV